MYVTMQLAAAWQPGFQSRSCFLCSWGQLHGNATFIGPQNLSTPDLFVQWLGNEIVEGNTCRNYRKQMAEVTPGWGVWGFVSAASCLTTLSDSCLIVLAAIHI